MLGWIFAIAALVITLALTVFFFGGIPVIFLILAIIIFLLVPFVWNFLAPSNRFFTFVQEGTAKIIVKADRPDKILIQWRGHTLDSEWNVVSDGTEVGGRAYREPWHPFGGLRVYGLWPLWDVYVYRLRWHDVHMTGGAERAERSVFHDENLDYVLLRPDVYWYELIRAETGGPAEQEPERIPLNVEFLVTMQVVNPYRAIFVAPIDWVENLMTRLAPVYRGFVASRTLDQLLRIRGSGTEIWDALSNSEDFRLLHETFEHEWGIQIVKNGIQIKDIGVPDAYQQQATLKWQAEREKERTIINADATSQAIRTVYGTIQEFGDWGRLIRTLEAAEKSPLAASLAVQAVPGLPEALRGIFGRPPEAITREEFSGLLEEIRALREEVVRSRPPSEEGSDTTTSAS